MNSTGPAVPLSLYVHLPWCLKKCPYCDFNSHAASAGKFPEQDYVSALLADLRAEQSRVAGRMFSSVFFGGGTPSLFSATSVDRILSETQARGLLQGDAEVTLEANPGASDSDRFRAFRDAGVNRISIGVQSLDDDALRKLGRVHDAATAVSAVQSARAAGFDELNVDLMHGLPDQDTDSALRDLTGAIDLEPTHLSWYELTIEPNTVFYSQPPPLPDDEVMWDIQQQGLALLADHGYTRYEVSAYRGSGRECRHNRNYWEFGDYLGIGAGAHGKISDPDTGITTRYARHRVPERYMQLAGTPTVVTRTAELQPPDLILEFMLNACRLSTGFSLNLFSERTGLPEAAVDRQLHEAQTRGLLDINGERVVPTALGQRYLNDLLQIFMPDTGQANTLSGG